MSNSASGAQLKVGVPVPGKLSDNQLNDVEVRRDEIISMIVERLSSRRTDLLCGRKLDMRSLGRCAGLLQAAVELQALIEINECGVEAKEQILRDLDSPPFKYFPTPEGWVPPCVGYIKQCIYRTEGYPDLKWPLKGGSEPGA